MEKITRNDFAFVEKLLYQQKTHATAISELQAELEDMMPSATASYVSFSHDKKNAELTQPERIAEIRLHSVKGKYLQEEIGRRIRHHRAICEAMKCLDDLEAQLVRLKYDLEKSSRDCSRTMGVQKSRWYEMRAEVVCKVARFLGLI